MPHSAASDLYFTTAMIEEPGWRRLSATVLESNRAVLVVRNHLGVTLPRGKALIYLIDDDLAAAVRDPGLGAGYRARLALVELRMARRLRAKAEQIVATSELLQAKLASQLGREVALMVPYWSERFATLDHFAPGAVPRVGFLGSLTHRGDLALVLEIFRLILAARPDIEVVMAANHAIPSWLADHPGFRPIAATDWPGYRRALAELDCQICLHPLADTPLNRARSPNKLIEFGVAGAAALYSETWPQSQHVTPGLSGLVLPAEPQIWADTVLDLLGDPARAKLLASGGQELAQRLNDPAPQRRFWASAMGLSQPN
ncbi:MAG: hypothetical protein AAGD07_15810 [Planctomycetota bacterium]